MEWSPLLIGHAIAALYVLALGPINIFRPRRDRTHRIIGYTWVLCMYSVCVSSFWIVTEGHLTWLHGLAALTIVSISVGLVAAVRRDVKTHRANMIGSYIGIAIAFGFAAFAPGRAVPRLRADDPATAAFVVVFILVSVAGAYFAIRPRRQDSHQAGTAKHGGTQ